MSSQPEKPCTKMIGYGGPSFACASSTFAIAPSLTSIGAGGLCAAPCVVGDDSGSTLSHAPSPATRQATRAHTASALDAAVATARVSRNCAFFEAGTAPSEP